MTELLLTLAIIFLNLLLLWIKNLTLNIAMLLLLIHNMLQRLLKIWRWLWLLTRNFVSTRENHTHILIASFLSSFSIWLNLLIDLIDTLWVGLRYHIIHCLIIYFAITFWNRPLFFTNKTFLDHCKGETFFDFLEKLVLPVDILFRTLDLTFFNFHLLHHIATILRIDHF